MARRKRQKNKKKKQRAAAAIGAAATVPERAAEQEAAKENDFVHELTHSVDPLAEALSALGEEEPDSKLDGDCPFCYEPLPPQWEPKKSIIASCCGAIFCKNCSDERDAHLQRSFERKGYYDKADEQLAYHCSLCRELKSADSQESEAKFLANAVKGRAWAQHYLGKRHLLGMDVLRPNARLGMELMIRAAKQGYPKALYELGKMYSEGDSLCGIKKSIANARFCYEESAIRGHIGARYYFAQTLDIIGKPEAAMEHLKVAMEAGYPKAFYVLGVFQYHGEHGMEQSIDSAKLHLEKAASLGVQAAVEFLEEHFE